MNYTTKFGTWFYFPASGVKNKKWLFARLPNMKCIRLGSMRSSGGHSIAPKTTSANSQRKIKTVSGILVLKLVTYACFRKIVFCLSFV